MLEYCDYIAHIIREKLTSNIAESDSIVVEVGKIQADLHPTQGWFQSTSKTLVVTDANDQKYKVTIEAVGN